MNFHDKIQEMDYELKQQNDNCIVIEKKRNFADIVIIFDLKEKVVSGYLKPNNILKEIDDISYQYSVFREMKSDLKELAELSKYEIL